MGTDITGTNKERFEKNIRRREKLTGYFYDMSKLVFSATVLTNIGIFQGNVSSMDVLSILFGLTFTVLLAWFGNRTLKY